MKFNEISLNPTQNLGREVLSHFKSHPFLWIHQKTVFEQTTNSILLSTMQCFVNKIVVIYFK